MALFTHIIGLIGFGLLNYCCCCFDDQIISKKIDKIGAENLRWEKKGGGGVVLLIVIAIEDEIITHQEKKGQKSKLPNVTIFYH